MIILVIKLSIIFGIECFVLFLWERELLATCFDKEHI